jgi:hypothetical protein
MVNPLLKTGEATPTLHHFRSVDSYTPAPITAPLTDICLEVNQRHEMVLHCDVGGQLNHWPILSF